MDWYLDPRDNRLLTREINITALQIDTHKQDSIQFNVAPTYELLEEDFNIAHWLDDPLTSRTYTLDRRLSSKILYTHRF